MFVFFKLNQQYEHSTSDLTDEVLAETGRGNLYSPSFEDLMCKSIEIKGLFYQNSSNVDFYSNL
jgi:hypothetical protein